MTVYEVARRFPPIAELRDLCRSLAMLDAILSPDWERRYYSFDAGWAVGVFSPAGAYVRGFDHEAPMSPYANDGEPWGE